ncbi:hypothetical protein BCR43DRAFT_498577 [Syncephalastrum racemosum]|uniref:Coiled-coil SMC6 And NSE5 INteracting (CANIN) domain-containing protein n=1 Tax=Syncephalastrum racemosum TaxID=13706 RepID=A0A1X2H134_SYNRA|nr:hypothetical protein BCR43DRAFT_498577 [Syncephalastrum racemosum]
MSLNIPTRRSKRIRATPPTQQSEEQRQSREKQDKVLHVSSVPQLVQQRRKRVEMDQRLQSLFDQLNQEPLFEDQFESDKEDETQRPTPPPPLEINDDDLLATDDEEEGEAITEGSGQESLEILAAQASQFMDEKSMQSMQRFKEVLTRTGPSTIEKETYRFFSERCKIPDPILLEDASDSQIDQTTRAREEYIYKLSNNAENRSLLLRTSPMRHWLRVGWPCPHHIYQWLFEIVAFDTPDNAIQAYNTLKAMWYNLGDDPIPFYDESTNVLLQERNENRYINLSTFKHVLSGYGAIGSEMEQTATEQQDMEDTSMISILSQDLTSNSMDDGDGRRIPLKQFGLVLKLFSYSVRTWPMAYPGDRIKYIVRLLCQITLDKAGSFLRQELQNAVAACLDALDKELWKEQVQSLADELCQRFPKTLLLLQLLDGLKPSSARSQLFRRHVAIRALNTAYRSQGGTEIESYNANILHQVFDIITAKDSIFQKREVDYIQMLPQATLLDAAVGNSEHEFHKNRALVKDIVIQLQLINRRIGARLGVLERTKTSEALQRLWNRLAYYIGRDATGALEDHHI